MNDFKLTIASDNGNSEHKFYINDTLFVQPNVIAKPYKLPNLEDTDIKRICRNITDNVIISLDSPAGLYYCGNYAINSSQPIYSIDVAENNKANSDIIFINIVGQAAAYTAAEALKLNNYELGDETLIANVDLATSLPIAQYTKLNREVFKNRFTAKKHRVTVYVGPKTVDVDVRFNYVKIIPEGVTSIFALKADDKYRTKYAPEEYNSKKILHIAIGEGTTEFPITTGIEFNPEFCKGSDNGIGHAIDFVIQDLRKETGISNLSRQKVSEIIKNPGHKYHNLVIDILKMPLELQAHQIYDNARLELNKSSNEVDAILIYGGGSILLREQIAEKLSNLAKALKTDIITIPTAYAATLEADGLNYFAKSDIFNKLKEKA